MKSSNAGHGVQVAGKSMRVLDTAQAAQVAQEHQEVGYGPDWPIPAPPATRPQAIVLASVSLSMAGDGDAEEKIETQRLWKMLSARKETTEKR